MQIVESLGYIAQRSQEDPRVIVAALKAVFAAPVLTINGLAHYDIVDVRNALVWIKEQDAKRGPGK